MKFRSIVRLPDDVGEWHNYGRPHAPGVDTREWGVRIARAPVDEPAKTELLRAADLTRRLRVYDTLCTQGRLHEAEQEARALRTFHGHEV